MVAKTAKSESHSDKFKALTRALECDEDEARWDEQLEKITEKKPASEKDQKG